MAIQYVAHGGAERIIVFWYPSITGVNCDAHDVPVAGWKVDDATGAETPLITAKWPKPPSNPTYPERTPPWALYLDVRPSGGIIYPDHYRADVPGFFDWLTKNAPNRKVYGYFIAPRLRAEFARWCAHNTKQAKAGQPNSLFDAAGAARGIPTPKERDVEQ